MTRPTALANTMDACAAGLRAVLALGCLPAASALAAGGPGVGDEGGVEWLRRVVQTLVAMGILVIMARPSGAGRQGRSPVAGGLERAEPRSMSSASTSGVR